MADEPVDDGPHVALLRAVNVGGTGKLSTAGLAAAATTIGLVGVKTVLQTGNLLFRGAGSVDVTARRLEEALATCCGLTTTVFVRTRVDWSRMLDANPFATFASRDPACCVAMVLATAPSAETADAVRAAAKGGEMIELRGRTAYIVYPNGLGRSKLTSALVERRLGVRGTARNWNTVMRIAAALTAM